jgi:predicted DNA binding protein
MARHAGKKQEIHVRQSKRDFSAGEKSPNQQFYEERGINGNDIENLSDADRLIKEPDFDEYTEFQLEVIKTAWPKLSPSMRAVLAGMSEGKGLDTVARELGVEKSTAREFLYRARRKIMSIQAELEAEMAV